MTALRDKAEDWATLFSVGHLKREEAWRGLHSTIMKSLEYPLVATPLTEIEAENIFTPIKNAALPKSGIVRTFPKKIIHAPLDLQGDASTSQISTKHSKLNIS